jgi:hypothetical protein
VLGLSANRIDAGRQEMTQCSKLKPAAVPSSRALTIPYLCPTAHVHLAILSVTVTSPATKRERDRTWRVSGGEESIEVRVSVDPGFGQLLQLTFASGRHWRIV